MATLIGRIITFEDEGLTRTGVIQRVSPLGALFVTVIDDLDDLKSLIIPADQPVNFNPPAPPGHRSDSVSKKVTI